MKEKVLIFLIPLCMLCIQASDHAGAENELPDLYSTKEFLTGNIDYYNHSDFTEIPKEYAYREDMFLLKETYEAFFKMYTAAKKEGLTLKIISATRTHTEQTWIWEDKWKKQQNTGKDNIEKIKWIMQYSAMPGTSRHHWGTEIDLNSLSDTYFTSGAGKKIYDWLSAHACEYGFCQVYDASYQNYHGHGEEKWHWSYFPISKKLPGLYQEKVSYSDIKGFSGSEYAKELNVIENYVTGVTASCCE